MVIFMVFKVGVCRVTARLVFCDKFVAYFYLGAAVPKGSTWLRSKTLDIRYSLTSPLLLIFAPNGCPMVLLPLYEF